MGKCVLAAIVILGAALFVEKWFCTWRFGFGKKT